MQDVPEFVRRAELTFQDYLDSRRPALLDAAHCVRLNYEAFFFADAWEVERFRSDPLLYCGLLTDPISRRRFHPTADSPRATFEGVLYFFEDAHHRERFEEAPERFRLPGWRM